MLDAMGIFHVHQLEGTECDLEDNSVFGQQFVKQGHKDLYRQYGGFVLSEKTGFSSFSGISRSCKGITFIVSPSQYYFSACTHSRLSECTCRPRIQEGDGIYRMVLRSRHIFLDLPQVSVLPSGGSFCYEGEYKVSFVCFSLPRRKSSYSGCFAPEFQLEQVQSHLRFSTSSDDGKPDFQNHELQEHHDSNCSTDKGSLVSSFNAKSPMVATSSRELLSLSNCEAENNVSVFQVLGPLCVDPSPNQSTASRDHSVPVSMDLSNPLQRAPFRPLPVSATQEKLLSSCSFDFSGFTPAFSFEGSGSFDPEYLDDLEMSEENNFSPLGLVAQHVDNRLGAWRTGLINEGFSPITADIIVSCHKATTQKQYQSGYSQWRSYLKQKGILDRKVTIATVCNFLSAKFHFEARALSTVKGYFYAIRDPLKHTSKLDVMSHREVHQQFAGMWMIRPPTRGSQLMPKWDLNVLLSYLNSNIFEPLERAPWDRQCQKTIILILFATGCEIANMTNDFEVLPNGNIKFDWWSGYKTKAEREDNDWSSTLPQIAALSAADKSLCPVRAFNIYFQSRLQQGSRFKGLWPVGTNKLYYLVKNVVTEAIRRAHPSLQLDDIPKIGVHHCRKFACSLSYKYFNGSLDDLCSWVGTKSKETLCKHYLREVPGVNFPIQVPFGSLFPDTEPVRVLSSV